ncbi:MAG: hypothetical protein AB8B65_02680, partial [Kordia sp.]|uniref:hypothetical protein n=1 Tax=Kordia sp. TaxID=1965332 RepID=UPI00385F6307
MCNLHKNVLLFVLALFLATISFSQTTDSTFVKEANALLATKPAAYSEIDAQLKKYKKDSLQLQYLA